MSDDILDDFETVTSDYWNPRDNAGAVHIIRPARFEADGWGPGDAAIIGEVVVLDEKAPGEGKVYRDAKIGGKAILNQLKGTLERQTRLVGRLKLVQPSGRGNAYWAFETATDQDKVLARKFLTAVAPF